MAKAPDAREKLSQEEVDTLLGGVDDISLEGVNQSDMEVRLYDFGSQERIVSGSMSGLYAVNERFIRYFRTSLMTLMRRSVNVSLVEIISLKAHEYLSSLAMPSCINLFRMRPLQGICLCVFDTPLVFSLVDTLFGGGAIIPNTEVEKEEFTQMEIRIVHLVLDLVFNDLTRAWQTIHQVKFDKQGTEINPQLINLGSQNEVVILERYRVILEGGKSSELHLAIPYATIEPIRGALESGSLEKEDIDENWASKLREEVFDAPVKISGSIANLTMSFKDLIRIKEGDVLPIEMHEMITVYAGGLPTFRAKFGVSNENCALKIMGRVDRE